jgi:hypothetical protein
MYILKILERQICYQSHVSGNRVHKEKIRVALRQERLCDRGCSVDVTEGRDL